MYYGNIKKTDVANGDGVRVSLYVSGCRNKCDECFNQVTWDFLFGKPFTEDTMNEILEALKPDYIAGFSLLGGEPFEEENQEVCTKILKKIKETYPEKDIWSWTGYLFDKDLLDENGRKHTQYTKEMLSYIDVLIDGRFMKDLKDLSLKYRGSSNQRVIDVQKSLKENKIILKNVDF